MAGPTDFHPVPVLGAWDETPSFRAVRLGLPAALAALHGRPGQVVKLRTAAGEGFFALSSAPSADGRAELLVKRGGRVADAVIAQAAPGAVLRASEPFGRGFPIEGALGRDVLLFAAGSGIAPIRALLQALLARRGEVERLVVFYGQRHGADFAYRSEHPGWERRGARLVLCPSAADDAWDGLRGRVQQVASALDFGGARLAEVAAYVCGMSSMVSDVGETLARAGVPPGRVHVNF